MKKGHADFIWQSQLPKKCQFLVIFIFLFYIPIKNGLCEISPGSNIRFRHLTIEDGLSQSSVNCILLDSKGFLWFGTEEGLNRFDGYTMVHYKTDPDDPHSISHSWVYSLIEDHLGNIWAGTRTGGLNRYDRKTDRFIRYLPNRDDPHSLNDELIYVVFEDRSGTIWIGTDGGGLHQYDREQDHFIRHLHDAHDPNSLSDDRVYSIHEDQSQRLWIGTFGGGLNIFNKETQQFHHIKNDPGNPYSLSDDRINIIYEDSQGSIWVGTSGGGLQKFDQGQNCIATYRHSPDDHGSVSNDVVTSIFEDRSGTLWIGTAGGGLCRFNRLTETFDNYRHSPIDPNSINHDYISSIYQDHSGLLWIGTTGGGLNIYNREYRGFDIFRRKPGDPNSLSHNGVRAILEDKQGNLWIGTFGGGLNRINRHTGTVIHYHPDSKDPHSISHDRIFSLCEDTAGNLWIGTENGVLEKFDRTNGHFIHYPTDPSGSTHYRVSDIYEDDSGHLWVGTRGGGLHRFNPLTERFTHFRAHPDQPDSLNHDDIYVILEDSRNTLWIGTVGGGLSKYDRHTRKFIRYIHNPEDPHSIGHNNVISVHESASGDLWIGCDAGLNKFNRESKTFDRYSEKDGLANNYVFGILEDESGHLWMSTNQGLSQFNPSTGTFINYDVSDGLQSNEFNGGASFKSRSGELFFGGINGFNAFYPGHIRRNTFVPPVVITDFQIWNESVAVGQKINDRVILEKSILETNLIELSHKMNMISFEFAALDYTASSKNQYTYIMEGLEKEWYPDGTRRFATYSNLPDGDYTFRVKGSNNDGVWNDVGASIMVKVVPPFWRRNWFRGLLILLILGSAVTMIQVHTHNIRKRAFLLEQKVEERTTELADANRKLNTSLTEKQVMLKEIHHRVKNNLQVISSLLSLQSRYIKEEKAREMFSDSQNRIRSMALIHEHLYQSDNLSKIDFSSYITRLAKGLFQTYDCNPEIINFIVHVDNIDLGIDVAVPCGLIINELVSNALKYAFPPTLNKERFVLEVTLTVCDQETIQLMVKDNGIGFPEDIDFRKSDSLGLRMIVVLGESQLQGKISLDREDGTTFLIRFPVQHKQS